MWTINTIHSELFMIVPETAPELTHNSKQQM